MDRDVGSPGRALRLSPLRFAGSKARCLDEVDLRFRDVPPGEFVYYEPMCGSLTVGLHVLERYRPVESHIADASPDIVGFFVALKHHYPRLVREIKRIVGDGMDEHVYYSLRRRFNEKRDDPVTAAAQFYVLNRGCFNGVYRVNAAGAFNVPFGRFKHGVCVVTPLMWAQLHRAHSILRSHTVHFACVDVETSLERAARDVERGARTLVFVDPPYLGSDKTLYHPREQFGVEKHVRVRDLLARLSHVPEASVVVTHAATPDVQAMFSAWEAHPLASERSVSAAVESRGVGGPHREVAYCAGDSCASRLGRRGASAQS